MTLINVKSMLITSSNFVSNHASFKGGAIYYECEEENYKCNLEIRGASTTFTSNMAGESGGAIYWGQVEPKFTNMSEKSFKMNAALIYANEIGSFPEKMIQINEFEYLA